MSALESALLIIGVALVVIGLAAFDWRLAVITGGVAIVAAVFDPSTLRRMRS